MWPPVTGVTICDVWVTVTHNVISHFLSKFKIKKIKIKPIKEKEKEIKLSLLFTTSNSKELSMRLILYMYTNIVVLNNWTTHCLKRH